MGFALLLRMLYPGESLSMAYQHLCKRLLAGHLQGCIDVDSTSKVADPSFATLAERCPLDPCDFFNCDPDTMRCAYTSVSASKCTNSLDGCEDGNCISDQRLDAMLVYICVVYYAQWELYNDSWLYFTLGLYVGALIALFLLTMFRCKDAQPSFLAPLTGMRSSIWVYEFGFLILDFLFYHLVLLFVCLALLIRWGVCMALILRLLSDYSNEDLGITWVLTFAWSCCKPSSLVAAQAQRSAASVQQQRAVLLELAFSISLFFFFFFRIIIFNFLFKKFFDLTFAFLLLFNFKVLLI